MKKKLLSKQDLRLFYPSIYDLIVSIYPLGLKNNQQSYSDFKGIKKLNHLISRNIINAKNHLKYWDKDFCDELEKYSGK